MDSHVRFAVLVDMLEAIVRTSKGPVKKKHVATFLDHVYKDHEFFSCMRLILPDLDKDRANYGLKESNLAKAIADALGLAKESEDRKKLVEWRKGGKSVGQFAGNFPRVAAEVLQTRQRQAPGTLKIHDVNEMLDRLAAAEKMDEKVVILSDILKKTTTTEMKWIICIILKEMKLGISTKSVFSVFHPDAEDLFNVTCCLREVCDKLKDRSQRFKRQVRRRNVKLRTLRHTTCPGQHGED
eukprot:TRINITY_DN5609_c0_g1_i2.p1 TRINITY_DN5609_c0_g1~~TRINITY_DN5609_c0_g1_i2.p1  ORF type:complete len:255 (-),score=34.21 TRINITY_DN5609_c0_g1_i2:57-776(-)